MQTVTPGADGQVGEAPPPPPDSADNWRYKAAPFAAGGLAVAACAYVAWVNPNEAQVFPECPLRAATGLDCPGCGMTRAVYALTQGDIVRALDHNVLLVVFLPLFAWMFLNWSAQRFGRELPSPGWTYRPWMTWALAVFVFGFQILRNMPAFSWLGSESV